MKERIYQSIIIVLTVMLFSVWQAYAGTPAGPGTPPAETNSYTLSDIYARLDAGTAGSESAFTEPTGGPDTGTMHTLNEIMGAAPTEDDTDGATVAEVATGKTFWGLTSGEWGVQTGTATLGGGSAALPKTGQTTSYATGDDGDLEMGVDWPNPRFTDNSNGTVTDELTGLIWLKDANCFGQKNWTTALSDANSLANGTCGLSDSSSAGDWRLPNVRELHSLIDYRESYPALPSGHPFTNVQTHYYWSSSTDRDVTTDGWGVFLGNGAVNYGSKTNGRYVWPVRGGQ
jgi:hypothetical protein